MRIKRLAIIGTAVWALLPTLAWATPLQVVASFSIIGDFARVVAGDHAAVTTLVGPESDAHSYDPTPSDAKTLAHADLIIVNGLGLEGWMDRLIASSGYKGQPLIASQGIQPLVLEDVSHPDPHAWQDIHNVKIYVTNIRDALIAKDPAHATDYAANAMHYLSELEALDQWVKAEIARISSSKRALITTHDAFQYFAHAYGITLHAPLGMNTESSPSAKAMAHLIDQIRSEHIHALFMENITDNRLIEQLKNDSNAYIGGTLYSDALSGAGGPAPTYLRMIKHNVTLMVEGMGHNP